MLKPHQLGQSLESTQDTSAWRSPGPNPPSTASRPTYGYSNCLQGAGQACDIELDVTDARAAAHCLQQQELKQEYFTMKASRLCPFGFFKGKL